MKKILLVVVILNLSVFVVFLGYYFIPYPQNQQYKVVIDGKKLTSLNGRVTGLTWNNDRGTLFYVTQQPTFVVEMDRNGTVLRRIPVTGGGKVDSIGYIGQGRYFIVQGNNSRLSVVTLRDSTLVLDLDEVPNIQLSGNEPNTNIAGLFWDPLSSVIKVIQEKTPINFYSLSFENATLSIQGWIVSNIFLRRYFSEAIAVKYDAVLREIFVIPSMAGNIVIYDRHGCRQFMPLEKGQYGLRDSITRPDAMATDGRGNLYIISASRLFYRFSV